MKQRTGWLSVCGVALVLTGLAWRFMPRETVAAQDVPAPKAEHFQKPKNYSPYVDRSYADAGLLGRSAPAHGVLLGRRYARRPTRAG